MFCFYPKTVAIKKSKINGEISVIKLFNSYRLIVAGCTQSGGLVKVIWEKVLKRIKHQVCKNPKILILGLGAGSGTKVASKLWPQSKITGIEIDPIIIELGKKYFALNKIPNLITAKADAIRWTQDKAKNSSEKFDLVLVDLYIGSSTAPNSENQDFLKAITKIVSPNGAVLFNRLVTKTQKSKNQEFESSLKKVFPKVNKLPTPANLMFIAKTE